MARTKSDKIFDNTFEESEFDGKSIKFEVAPSYKDNKDSEDQIQLAMLMESIDNIVNESKYKIWNAPGEDGKIPKLNKLQINEIYSYISSRVTGYSKIELFSSVSEYFDIYPTKFYNSLSNSFKEELILELDKKMNVLEKKQIQRLF